MSKDQILSDISSSIAELLGLNFPRNRWIDLERGVVAAAKELGLGGSVGNIAIWLASRNFLPGQLDVLTNHLTVGETYFFRDKAALKIFQDNIIPEILTERIGKDQRISIWSAGCCTGEEPYTLAMLLLETVPDFQNWKISILATDINPRYLEKARTGIFGNWSFRETPEHLQAKYFEKVGNQWQISKKIREMVIFNRLNLAENSFPSLKNFTLDHDVIFCRNVLMYFSSELIKQVGLRFFNGLNPNGWLITSAVELNDTLFDQFAKVYFDKSILYRKIHQKHTPVIVPPLLKPAVVPLKPKINLPIKRNKPVTTDTKALLRFSHHKQASPLQIADKLFKNGQYGECAFLCQNELTKTDYQAPFFELLAKSCANLGRLDEALKGCRQWIKTDSFNAEAYFLMATIQTESQKFAEAEDTLKRGLYVDHDHLMLHLLMSNILARKGNWQGAEIHVKNVKRLLSGLDENYIIDKAEGLTVGRIIEMAEKKMTDYENT